MDSVTLRDMPRDIDVTDAPAKAGSVTRWNSPPLGGVQCHAHAPNVTAQFYTGPIDADLSTLDPRDTAAFWAEALTHKATVRASMRQRWPEYRGKVPDALARDLINDIEAKGASHA